MDSNEDSDRRTEIERSLQAVSEQKGERFAARIRPIILRNLERGRVRFFLENSSRGTCQDYVRRVVESYENQYPYLELLQNRRSSEVWSPLYKNFQNLAYNFLLRKRLIPGEVTRWLAMDAATDAAVALLQAQFPYDTDFEPWAYNFIKYSCLKHIEKEVRSTTILFEQIFQEDTLYERIDLDQKIEAWELRVDLFNAFHHLARNRQQVLSLRYNHGLPFDEIAKQMGKSANAVNQLHHNAIKQLHRLLVGESE